MEKLRYRFFSSYRGSPETGEIVRGERGEVRHPGPAIEEWEDLRQEFWATSLASTAYFDDFKIIQK